jgi:KaiC/GvpD/RAD55 family RecA-like ATPase
MSENDCDIGFKRLQELILQAGGNFSELDTRAKLIDRLFIDCLGYAEADVFRDVHVDRGFLDYVFRIDGVPRFVLEAKKADVSFNIPSSFAGRYYKIDGAIITDGKIKRAIEQAQQYCINAGVNHGIISNGHQYIVFVAFRYGASWRSGNCMIFRSLEDIRDNFTMFWNVMSKQSVKNGSLRKYISKEEMPLQFHRPIDELQTRDSPLTRNDMSSLLQPFIDHFLDDIIGESKLDVLKRCYVGRQYENAGIEISRHFDRPPSFAKKYNPSIIFESKGVASSFEARYEKSEEFLRTKTPRGSTILIMGGIGTGKTTFIYHFFNFVIKQPENTIWFYVNFVDASPNPEEIEHYIFSSIVREYEDRYADRLKDEMVSMGIDSVESNPKSVTVLLTMLTLKGYTVSLVLDNVDQHSHISPVYQERVLQLAKHLTGKLKTITIVTLREESFFRSTMSGVLDAFPVPVFHVSSPSFGELVRARINYILELLKKGCAELELVTGTSVNFSQDKEKLKTFFEILRNSFTTNRRTGKEIIRFIEDVCGGDMREALRLFKTFLVSGNTNVDEMLSIESSARKQGKMGYQVPLHHFVKSIVLEHSRLYSKKHSRIMNLFDTNSEYSNSHFLNLRILRYLHVRLNYEPPQGRGFVEIDSIIREAERVGISRPAIADSLKGMAFFGLIQFENQSKIGYDNAAYVRITNAGLYYLNELSHTFSYLDLVWLDTPILNRDLVESLLDHVVEIRLERTEDDLSERFTRTELFLTYLQESEERELKNNTEFRDSDLTREVFMPRIIESYQKQKEYIRAKQESRHIEKIDDPGS